MTAAVGSVQDLFTDAVQVVQRRGDVHDESLLWPEEDALLGEVAPGRRRDFVNGRWCARHAMVALGVAPEPVLRSGEDRAPAWPRGLVGSITHTDTYAAAAVGFAELVLAVGIDAEPDAALPDRVLRRVAFDAELSWVEQCGPRAGQDVTNADRLLFSAKEAIYKAWYPLAGSWLGFEDARVTFDPDGGTFEAQILVEGPLGRLPGRYAALDGVIVTAVELPRRQR